EAGVRLPVVPLVGLSAGRAPNLEEVPGGELPAPLFLRPLQHHHDRSAVGPDGSGHLIEPVQLGQAPASGPPTLYRLESVQSLDRGLQRKVGERLLRRSVRGARERPACPRGRSRTAWVRTG